MARQAVAEPKAVAKPRARAKMEKDEYYVCSECGLTVQVVEPCACGPEVCYITCCERPMEKTASAGTAKRGTRASATER
ncbi:MAG: hypothetical protein HYY32_02095 [Chloroflexi bacterium]|nr:hypothetical protein [Chloroflexota bacterium]